MNIIKPIQKNTFKQVRQNSLLLIQSQQPLLPDQTINFNASTFFPLNLNEILIKQPKSHKNKLQNIQGNNQTEKKFLQPTTNSNSADILLQKLILSYAEIERLNNQYKSRELESESNSIKQNLIKQLQLCKEQNIELTQKCQDLIQRYHQGEQVFYQLNSRCQFLENQVKKLSKYADDTNKAYPIITQINGGFQNQQLNKAKIQNQRIITQLYFKENEMKNVQTQLNLAREQIIKLKSLDSQKKGISIQINQMKLYIDQLNFQKNQLIVDQKRLNDQLNRFKFENTKLIQELNFLKIQYKKLSEEIIKSRNQIGFLKGQMNKKENLIIRSENESLLKAINQQKLNNAKYITENQKLVNQLKTLKSQKQKEKQEIKEKLQLEFCKDTKQKIKQIRDEMYKIQRQKDLLVRNLADSEHNLQVLKLQYQNQKKAIQMELMEEHKKYQKVESQYLKVQLQLKQARIKYNSGEQLQTKYEGMTQNLNKLKLSKQGKELEIEQLKSELKKVKQELNYHKLLKNSREFTLKTQSQSLYKSNNENRYLEINTYRSNNASEESETLKKHLQISVKELKGLYESTKQTNQQLTKNLIECQSQKKEIMKKQQYQQFELSKLHEVLRTRRQQLEMCYKIIDHLRKNAHISHQINQKQHQMIKSKREHEV